MNDYLEDFDDQEKGGFDIDGFGKEGMDDDNPSAESGDYPWDGPEWQDWMIIGPLSEDIAKEKRKQDRIIRELDDADDEYWDIINRRWWW